jgi:hypothetical protein
MGYRSHEKILLIVAALCVGALVGDRLVLTPLLGVWEKRSDRIAQLRQDLTKADALLERSDSTRDRWDEMQGASLPADAAVVESVILNAISAWSRKSGLTVTSVKPRWGDERDENLTIDCRVGARGEMPAFVRFLYDLETGPLALRTEEIKVSSREETGRNLTLSVRFTGLHLRDRSQP